MFRRNTARLFSLALLIVLLTGSTVAAASSDSLYSYNLRSAQPSVTNQAAKNQSTPLTLRGAWSSNSEGVLFGGNLSGSQSVGYAKPASGMTVDIPASQAVGLGAAITYQHTCLNDSQNVTQVGFFSPGESQLKLQLSKCTNNKVYPECRIAGAATPKGTAPVRGSVALQNGSSYYISCTKAPDAGGRAQVVLELMRTDGSSPVTVSSNTFSIPASGALRSSKYLSVANKYPLPSASKNTDQYKGYVAGVIYCKSLSAALAQDCVQTELSGY